MRNYFKVRGASAVFSFDDKSKSQAQAALIGAQEFRDYLHPGEKIVVFRASGFGRVRGVLEVGYDTTRDSVRMLTPAERTRTLQPELIGVTPARPRFESA